MQAQGQICSITVFIIQCLPGSGKPWKDFQDKRQCWIPLHKLATPPTFGTFADVQAAFVDGTGRPSSLSTSLPTCVLSNFPTSTLYMSTTSRTAGSSRSNDNFTAIFQAASNEYQRTTGKSLDTHPFTTQLNGCDSPEATLNVFRTQVQDFSKFRKSDENLMKWLDPIVHIVFTFSKTLGEGIGLVCRFNRRILSFTNVLPSEIFTRKNGLHRYWHSSRGVSLL